MNSQVDFLERREHPRVGVMAQLQDITYSALRKHGIANLRACEATAPKLITQDEETTMIERFAYIARASQ